MNRLICSPFVRFFAPGIFAGLDGACIGHGYVEHGAAGMVFVAIGIGFILVWLYLRFEVRP